MMGAWGSGIWQNDCALDEVLFICEWLLSKASSLVEIAEDPVEFQSAVAFIDSAAAVCENSGFKGDTLAKSFGRLKTSSLTKLEALTVNDSAGRAFYEPSIQTAFDRLIRALSVEKKR